MLKSSETFLLVSPKLAANHRKSTLLKDDCSRHNLFSEANSLLVLEGARVFQEIIRMFLLRFELAVSNHGFQDIYKQERFGYTKIVVDIWGFPKMVVPNNHGFSY